MSFIKLRGNSFPLFFILISLCLSCSSPQKNKNAVKQTVENWYISKLESIQTPLKAILYAKNIDSLKNQYSKARNIFKQAEPVMQFIDAANYKYLNSPNLEKIEEEDATNIKHLTLTGFQLLEEAIFLENNLALANKHALQISDRIRLMRANTNLEPFEKYHFLWMIREELMRIASTGITPFDSPALNNYLNESAIALNSVQELIAIYEEDFQDELLFKEWKKTIDSAVKHLQKSTTDNFNAYHYLKNINEKFFSLWVKTVNDWKVEFPFSLSVSNSTNSYFSAKTFEPAFFAKRTMRENEKEFELLGEKLFFETKLSDNQKMSCGSCHKKELYFTDGLKIPFKGSRNTPTLYYSGLQHQFFYDGSSGSLEGQIISVIQNPNEFHSDVSEYYKSLKDNIEYKNAFQKLYKSPMNDENLRDALATYVRSLSKFDSKFDRNVRGEEQTFSEAETRGFNLYMGKAQCGTCHFAPIFNGTVPPKFSETELEHIGTPKTRNLNNTSIDTDLGRFNVFETPEKKYFFKTPTLRNIEKTAPYMHNGVFKTLEEVVDFYNKGGGNGIGFNQKHQTLPSESLNLTEVEKSDLVLFLKTLTDKQ